MVSGRGIEFDGLIELFACNRNSLFRYGRVEGSACQPEIRLDQVEFASHEEGRVGSVVTTPCQAGDDREGDGLGQHEGDDEGRHEGASIVLQSDGVQLARGIGPLAVALGESGATVPRVMSQQEDTFSPVWAIIEVMGHRTYAGRVTEQRIAGAGFVRIDIPEVGGKGGTTKMLGTSSIFALHLTTEEIARSYVERGHEQAIDAFAKLGASPAPAVVSALDGGDWSYEEDDDDGDTEDGEDAPF